MKLVVTSLRFRMEKPASIYFLFSSFKMKFKPFTIRHATISKQPSTVNNIFKATSLTNFRLSKGIETLQAQQDKREGLIRAGGSSIFKFL